MPQVSWQAKPNGRYWLDVLVALSGQTTAQLLDPTTRQPIGPHMSIEVFRGDSRVPSRVGVVFFHRRAGCRVFWDLEKRSWGVEYP